MMMIVTFVIMEETWSAATIVLKHFTCNATFLLSNGYLLGIGHVVSARQQVSIKYRTPCGLIYIALFYNSI